MFISFTIDNRNTTIRGQLKIVLETHYIFEQKDAHVEPECHNRLDERIRETIFVCLYERFHSARSTSVTFVFIASLPKLLFSY